MQTLVCTLMRLTASSGDRGAGALALMPGAWKMLASHMLVSGPLDHQISPSCGNDLSSAGLGRDLQSRSSPGSRISCCMQLGWSLLDVPPFCLLLVRRMVPLRRALASLARCLN